MPLWKAVEGYVHKGWARFHMPGHKGAFPFVKALAEAAHYDITEVAGADSLYEAKGLGEAMGSGESMGSGEAMGPIAETEAAFAELYGSAGAFLSAGGSTLCIQAMLALAGSPGDKMICARGVHTAALNAMALLDLQPVWVFPEADPVSGLSATVTAGQIGRTLEEHPGAAAVYITSPTYYGLLADVGGIAAVCRERGVPLLVDNAHGAHLKLALRGSHPMELGADMCCDSLHKTLPVLTGGALLHIGNPRFLPEAKRKMSLFGSTSPSYLILLSMDGILPYLRGECAADLARVSTAVRELEALARKRGFLIPEGRRDPIRLTLNFAPTGLDAGGFRAHLAGHGIEPELCGGEACVFLAGAANTGADFARLRAAILGAPFPMRAAAGPPEYRAGGIPAPEQAVSLRTATLAPRETVPIDLAAGRIAASAVAPCPPGIPLAAPGERLSVFTLSALKKSGILSVDVLELE